MVTNAAAATACSSAYSAVGGAPTVNVRSTWPAYSGAAAALISQVTTSPGRITRPVGHWPGTARAGSSMAVMPR